MMFLNRLIFPAAAALMVFVAFSPAAAQAPAGAAAEGTSTASAAAGTSTASAAAGTSTTSAAAGTSTTSAAEGFQYSSEVSGPIRANMLYQVRLPESVIVRSENDMRDIRLYSPDGGEVPFVILSNETPAEFVESHYLFEKVSYSEDTSSATVILKLPEKHQPIRSIDIQVSNVDFKKDVTVFGSRDMNSWTEVARDTIYDFSSKIDLRKTEIKFASVDHRYFKLVVSDTDPGQGPAGAKFVHLKCEDVDFTFSNMKKEEKLRFDNFYGRTTNNLLKGRSVFFDSKVFSNPKATIDKNRNSVITIEADLPLDRIYFEIANPFYFRDIRILYSDSGKEESYQQLANCSVHSFPLSDINQVRTDFMVSSRKHKFYRFIVSNKNNPPLNITAIKFEWVQPIMFFAALGDAPKHVLGVGNKNAPAPEYDLTAFVNQGNWFRQKFVELAVQPPVRNQGFRADAFVENAKKAQMEKIVLTVIVICLVIVLGFWMFRLMSKIPPQEPGAGEQS